MGRPAVFLDRDGTLNVESGYVHRWEDWEWIHGAIDAITRLNRMGLLVVVVSNQAGVARGYYDEAAIQRLHDAANRDLAHYGARIDAYYYCPHHPEHGEIRDCACRKPAPGLLIQAAHDLDIDLARSWLVGDKATDIEAGIAAGVSPILVETGYGEKERMLIIKRNVMCVRDLLSAVACIASGFGRRTMNKDG